MQKVETRVELPCIVSKQKSKICLLIFMPHVFKDEKCVITRVYWKFIIFSPHLNGSQVIHILSTMLQGYFGYHNSAIAHHSSCYHIVFYHTDKWNHIRMNVHMSLDLDYISILLHSCVIFKNDDELIIFF